MAYHLIDGEVVAWARAQEQKPIFHALLTDPPYNLTSVTKRFGGKNSAPAKFGTDGVFQRSSKGFMGQTWDDDVAFRPDTWEAFKPLLYPGAFGMAFSHARNYHRMATAIEQAGYIIHSMFVWVYSSGFPKATRVGDEAFDGHRYGAALKPAVEPIAIFQKPYETSPRNDIITFGSGTLSIDAARIPANEPYTVNTWDDNAHPFGGGAGNNYTGRIVDARWPANLAIDAEVGYGHEWSDYFFKVIADVDPFHYFKKANTAERRAGLTEDDVDHATYKPLSLTEHLATLLLPPEKYAPRMIFVPFAGVYSEVIGAAKAGWEDVVAVERESKFSDMGYKRLRFWLLPDRSES